MRQHIRALTVATAGSAPNRQIRRAKTEREGEARREKTRRVLARPNWLKGSHKLPKRGQKPRVSRVPALIRLTAAMASGICSMGSNVLSWGRSAIGETSVLNKMDEIKGIFDEHDLDLDLDVCECAYGCNMMSQTKSTPANNTSTCILRLSIVLDCKKTFHSVVCAQGNCFP